MPQPPPRCRPRHHRGSRRSETQPHSGARLRWKTGCLPGAGSRRAPPLEPANTGAREDMTRLRWPTCAMLGNTNNWLLARRQNTATLTEVDLDCKKATVVAHLGCRLFAQLSSATLPTLLRPGLRLGRPKHLGLETKRAAGASAICGAGVVAGLQIQLRVHPLYDHHRFIQRPTVRYDRRQAPAERLMELAFATSRSKVSKRAIAFRPCLTTRLQSNAQQPLPHPP